jgi:hypothetical protein
LIKYLDIVIHPNFDIWHYHIYEKLYAHELNLKDLGIVHTPVIPAMWEVEIGGSQCKASRGKS